GFWGAWRLWGRGRGLEGGQTVATRWPTLHRLLVNKYYVDEIYDRMVVQPVAALARFCWKAVDAVLIEGAVHAGPLVVRLTGDLGRFTTTGNVRNYALYFFVGLLFLFWWLVA
ncbi:MAG: hypothetical protein V3T81_08430, partial [Thermoanaerobaculia bacterium]